MSTPRLRLGQLLVDAKLISADALEEALATQKQDGRRLGTLLVERGYINETQLTPILSHQLAVPWVSLLHIEFSRQLLNLVPHDVADRFCLVPIYVRHVRGQGNTLYVAMDDPSNEEGLKSCREHSGLPARAMIAPPSDIRSAIRVYYGVGPAPAEAPAPTPSAEPPPAAPPAAAEPSEPTAPPAEAERPSAEPEPAPPPSDDGPTIEAVEIALPLRGLVEPSPAPAAGESEVEHIPRPRGRAPKMVSLTLLDGTTINLPAKRRARPTPTPAPPAEQPAESESTPASHSDPPGPEAVHGLTARDLVVALRAAAHGADASEVLGSNVRWESLFAALLSLMLKKHVIADWEFVEELKKHV